MGMMAKNPSQKDSHAAGAQVILQMCLIAAPAGLPGVHSLRMTLQVVEAGSVAHVFSCWMTRSERRLPEKARIPEGQARAVPLHASKQQQSALFPAPTGKGFKECN